jgi:hypothetical protein
MARRETGLPASFSLLNSEFNDFLFAPIGTEHGDQVLTVLSAFSRDGIDPWQQATRLQRLPKKQALQNLAAIIATLSDEPRSPGKSQALADQLIELLPRRPSFSMRFAAHRRGLWAQLARHLPR